MIVFNCVSPSKQTYLRFLRATIWSPAPTVRDLTLNFDFGDADTSGSWPSLSCKVVMSNHKDGWHILMSHRVNTQHMLCHLVCSLLSDVNLVSDVSIFANLEIMFYFGFISPPPLFFLENSILFIWIFLALMSFTKNIGWTWPCTCSCDNVSVSQPCATPQGWLGASALAQKPSQTFQNCV